MGTANKLENIYTVVRDKGSLPLKKGRKTIGGTITKKYSFEIVNCKNQL